MPCLDRDGLLPRSIAQAIGYSCSSSPRSKLVLFGHADEGSFDSANNLSSRRAMTVRALLQQDATSWKLASMSASLSELSLTLAGVAASMGWDCNTDSLGHLVEGVPSQTLQNFQAACISRYQSPMCANGLPSHVCWHGVFCILVDLINKFLRQEFPCLPGHNFGFWPVPSLGFPEGRGVFPCGASFPNGAGSMAFASRRVDMVFLPDNLKLSSAGLSPGHLDSVAVPIYGQKVRFRPIDAAVEAVAP